jgi:hypothetical protein
MTKRSDIHTVLDMPYPWRRALRGMCVYGFLIAFAWCAAYVAWLAVKAAIFAFVISHAGVK